MDSHLTRTFIFLAGVIVGFFVMVMVIATDGITIYLPLTFDNDSDARLYQQMCLGNEYSALVSYSAEFETLTVTCMRNSE